MNTWSNEPRVILAHSAHVNCVAFSPDDGMVVSAGFSGELRGWNVGDLALRHEFVGHTHSVNAIVFVNDQMISGSRDGSLRVWSPDSATCIRSVGVTKSKSSAGIGALRVHRERELLVLSTPASMLQVRNLKSMEVIANLKSSTRNIGLLAISAAGDRALVGGMGSQVYIFDLPACQPLGSFEAHPTAIGGARFFDNDRRIATVGYDGTLAVWDSATNGLITRRSIAEQSGGYWLAIAHRPLVAVSGPQAVRLFDLDADCRLIATLASPIKGNYGLCFSSNDRLLALAAADKRVRIWDLPEL